MSSEDYLNKTDQDLVVESLVNKDSYRYLMERYEAKLMRYIMRLVRVAKEDAEDILQEVFIKTYVNLNGFDPRMKFSSWIYRITHNEAMTHLRRLKTRPKTFDLELNEVIVNKLRADLDIEKGVDQNYLKQNMEKILKTLDKRYQEAIILRYMEDRDYQEISDILRKPMGTVAILLKRAKEQIKKNMLANNISF